MSLVGGNEGERIWAIIDKKTGLVVNTIAWDGTVYDPDTNPSGLMLDAQIVGLDKQTYTLSDCEMIEVTDKPEAEEEHAEIGGTYDFKTQTFTRPEYVPPAPPTAEEIKQTIDAKQLLQTLLDKGIISESDLTAK